MQMIDDFPLNDVSSLTQEYKSMIEDCHGLDRELLKVRLIRDADWTYGGAEELVYLAERYGSFVLRNALALSLALGIEDGNAGL
jgi:hypothetical protein